MSTPAIPAMGHSITLFLLRLGIAIPFLYFGLQLVAAPFYPDYSFIRNVASELGSDRAPQAMLFNRGMMLQGLITLLAAVGFFRAFRRLAVNRVLAYLTCLMLAMNGIQTLWAGYFPMPDPRHGGHPLFVICMLLLTPLMTAALWKMANLGLKVYFVIMLILLAAMVPFMSGMTGIDASAYRGLLQRLFTFTLFPPIGVAAGVLVSRLTRG